MNDQYDIIVIGGGPAGYAAAIRAGQLKKRVLCIEKEDLGGTCLNWGCIPTKALLESGAFIRRLRQHPGEWGVSFDNLSINFPAIIGRSRDIAGKLSAGIAHLFSKYGVKHERGVATVLAAGKVRLLSSGGAQDVTAKDIIIATGARARALPGIDFDGDRVISSREAMSLKEQPQRLAIIGAGAIGCEFSDFYNAIGTKVILIEMLDHILPIEDEDCSIVLERSFAKRGIEVLTKTKTQGLEKTATGVKLTLSNARGTQTIDADKVLLAVGVTANLQGVINTDLKLELFKNHVKVDDKYQTNIPGIWAAGDVIGPPWLAHVAHHEAVACVEHICGAPAETIDYANVPGCTYTHPQVASVGLTERKCREENRDIKIGKFPFSASGRALAAGATEGFVKLIFDAKRGQLLGAHMIGENVTEMLAELVIARKLETTESQIIETMHPHPTMSEAIMEAAGVAFARSIHL